MKNILFIAPPAGGKGTKSDMLVEDFGYVHISTGDLLRNLDKTTPLGKEVSKLMEEGKLVSDDIVLELLKEKLTSIGDVPFILDGCPRNIHQAEVLETMLPELGTNLDLVIELSIPYEETLRRAVGRLVCPKCNATFNKYGMAPKVEGICDKCGDSLVNRSDDTEETYKVRYDTYMKETAPLIDFYKEKGKLVSVDGVNNTYESIVNVIKND